MKKTKEKVQAENPGLVNKGRRLVPTRIKDADQRRIRSRSLQAHGRYQPRESRAAPPHESLRASSPLRRQVRGGAPGLEPGGPTRRWTCGVSARRTEFRGIR